MVGRYSYYLTGVYSYYIWQEFIHILSGWSLFI